MVMRNLDVVTVGVLFISLSLSIALAAAGAISWLIVPPLIISIMGVYGVAVSLTVFGGSIYHLGWSAVVLILGVLWICNILYPELTLYLFALLIGFVGVLIIISALKEEKKTK